MFGLTRGDTWSLDYSSHVSEVSLLEKLLLSRNTKAKGQQEQKASQSLALRGLWGSVRVAGDIILLIGPQLALCDMKIMSRAITLVANAY